MGSQHVSGPWLFRPDSDLSGAFCENMPVDIMGQFGPDGLGGLLRYFNHFLQWEGPTAEGSAGGWTLSGVTGVATIVLSDVRAGEIVLTADATAGADPTLQLGSATAGMSFRYVVGKRMWCHARLKIGTVTSTEMLIGLATADTEPTVTNTFPADGIFLEKAAAATTFDFHARKDGTSTERTAQGTTLVNDTYIVVGFYVDATGNIHLFMNNAEVTAGLIAAGTANIPSGAADTLQFMVGFRGASQTVALDWLLMGQEI